MFKLALAMFWLEAKKGHLKWKVTDLARKANVSRTLIYRYFGNTREKILVNSLQIFCDEFYGFSGDLSELSFVDKIVKARELMAGNFEAVLFYQRWRTQKSWIQHELIRVEKKFQSKLKKSFPHLDENSISALHAFIHGIVTAPFYTPEDARRAVLILSSQLCRAVEYA